MCVKCLQFFYVYILIFTIFFPINWDHWSQSIGGCAALTHTLEMDNEKESEIAQFYKDRSVFITGATGFMGKVSKLINKILILKE